MNKLFYFLLFSSVAGAGVLWWLMHSSAETDKSTTMATVEAPNGLVIEDRPSAISVPRDAKVADAVVPGESEEAPAPKSDHSPKSETPAPPATDAKASTLSISSEPEGVNVFLDGRKVGVTPIERTLTTKVQKYRFEKEGFIPVERDAPAEAKPEGAYMSWRISMVSQQVPAAQKSRMDEADAYFLKGRSGPVFVQIRAVDARLEPRPAIIKELQETRKRLREERIFACEVSLGTKGNWSRILAGPFASREEARRSLRFLKESLQTDDLFVTGEQSCL